MQHVYANLDLNYRPSLNLTKVLKMLAVYMFTWKKIIQRKMCIVWAVIVGICVERNCAIYFSVYQAQLEYSIKLLEDYKNGTLPPGITDKELWEAQKIKQVWCPIKEQSYSRLALIESIFVKLQLKIYYPW